ncbi:pyochelin biosynthesis salicyl-AMP ligase PchD [Kribbella jejuensis]|uniref:2,3-dihydroxybenzoate-AMP ligase n=1 Tax=Kribbella jejuensis TaxID=236068 RepID=A0A542EMQ8_9ACTN|nr:AMP-binding protein [Kribbella jejuensis]TQJ16605.1 2,3-dihydroxybenzoate-AMP ligase [Kribbella jejuensis]
MTTTVDDFPAQDPVYRTAGLWESLTIPAQFAKVVAQHTDRLAVITAEGVLSYGDLDARSDRIAAGLLQLGLDPGDRVLLQITNRLESIIAWYALLKAALVPVATLAPHREHEINAISRQAEAKAHLVEASLPFDLITFATAIATNHPTLRHLLTIGTPTKDAPLGSTAASRAIPLESLGAGLDPAEARALVAAAQATVDPDDLAVLQLSGGTTGTPKLIPRQHAEYWYNAAAYAERLGWTHETRVAHLIPVVHNAGITCAVHAAASVGATLVLGTVDPATWVPLIARTNADAVLIGHGHFSAFAAPGVLDAMPSLRQVILSGAKVPDRLFDELERRGIWSGQLFGMGEGLFCVSNLDDPREARLRTVGTALSPLDEIKLLQPDTELEVADGEVGELCARGPYTIRGYYRAADHNRRAFTSDGFYRTGDLARWGSYDGRAYLHIEGRIKDVINRGGEKISADEVERLLLAHPSISQAAVVAMPDARLGEKACAFVVADRDLDVPDVQHHLSALGVAKFKWPERVVRVAELPRTNVGKIDKTALRRLVPGSGNSPAG